MAESGFQYFKSLAGILKVLQFVVLLIAIGAVGYYLNEYEGDFKKKENLQLFIGAAVVAWLFVIFFFFSFLTGLTGKLKAINWPLAVGIIFALLSILLLVASALLAHTVKYYDDNTVCDILELFDAKAQCKHLIVGAVFGFLATVLIVIDAVVHFRM